MTCQAVTGYPYDGLDDGEESFEMALDGHMEGPDTGYGADRPQREGKAVSSTETVSSEATPGNAPPAEEALAFVRMVAYFRKDGEGPNAGEDGSWIMENDDAFETVHDLIDGARGILGWEPGRPPLDGEEYLEFTEPDEDGDSDGDSDGDEAEGDVSE